LMPLKAAWRRPAYRGHLALFQSKQITI
jgi:hypothetical protein